MDMTPDGFAAATPFAPAWRARSESRRRITDATRRPEPECVAELLRTAPVTPASATAIATRLVEALRARGRPGPVEGLMREYALSSQEGIALMCLAEALLRIPDAATRDRLIRDKIGGGDWRSHLGRSPSLFVNAATWGLLITGRLQEGGGDIGSSKAPGLQASLMRALGRGGEPLIRAAMDRAMRVLGEQFVVGETIESALRAATKREARGFRYSFDMLGEAAMTEADAQRYLRDYQHAIRAIGAHNKGRGLFDGAGISIKLSALHPRYSRAQQQRVRDELLPRLADLASLARAHDVGLNIDAEEADRLELSLDLLESLCEQPDLAGWNGIGFVIQAYSRRTPMVIDHLVELARRTGHRLMVRLVKGAYWDSEIKKAQEAGLSDYPVFTRKLHTDVSYLDCARRLLAAPDAIFPQFATHNAQTVGAVMAMAGPDFAVGQYEFQCLHGMGESLYEQVVAPDKFDRPCRIYAPVGTHETLLAYLVRRLLENGANSSFVNRIADPAVQVADLVADPVQEAARAVPIGAPHAAIPRPGELFAAGGAERPRRNSSGLDLASEATLEQLAGLHEAATTHASMPLPVAEPLLAFEGVGAEAAGWRDCHDPADHRRLIGRCRDTTVADVGPAIGAATEAAAHWAATPAATRADCLDRAADALDGRLAELLGPIMREAGKSAANAIGEVREAVDFLRYYAAATRRTDDLQGRALGAVVCISPWNFPLSIFIGQVAASLAAGNTVLAKPAEQTPLIATLATAILHQAGIPRGALQLLPGDGEIGAALVADPRIGGVLFTGSTDVARSIAQALAPHADGLRGTIPLIAETGGQNALLVDSAALPEQVVTDAISSAFDSAGQRCSALRVLCVQEDAAAPILAMLKGAMAELRVGDPLLLATDVGPVIDEAARERLERHIDRLASLGCRVTRTPLSDDAARGTFVAPALIEIDTLEQIGGEVFGPVLHVLRYSQDRQDAMVDAINATGYGLTFGVHTRIDETMQRLVGRSTAGNIYVNRNMIGAVVGSQPFGGTGLSGTGPKAGGPLMLHRLRTALHERALLPGSAPDAAVRLLDLLGDHPAASACAALVARSPLGFSEALPGPVGERNLYSLAARGDVLCVADDETDLVLQITAALATGNRAVLRLIGPEADVTRRLMAACPALVVREPSPPSPVSAALASAALLPALAIELAERPGAVTPLHRLDAAQTGLALEWLNHERSLSINTTAAGGNASLMALS
ncbi:bifunctional proline dehydrogenase/L-glutamate gamma-semialdehyde dehydrogenase PutA [Lichenicola sp.]|uniref:bifunctional proline dehydrogenase/L-glutamate gamma-semialdehyde dehydrogenase PutA n=1 Tax=Lichenicola sp. TaxID=2804529 RepID=UPI003AFF7B6B